VIRETIFLRYSLIHYLYTSFDQGSKEGIPIMRPMFLDFPSETDLFDTASQFMWGDSILVSPKMKSPVRKSLKKLKFDETPMWEVRTHLPTSARWYNLNTGELEAANH